MNKVSYMGNGEIVEFDFTFPFYENNNVVVLKNNKPATGYTIVKTPAGDGADVPYIGGRVVFDFAPLPTDSIVISRKLPLSRVVDYQPLAKIEPKLLNLDMNYLMESLKDFQDELDTFNECYNGIVNVESVEVFLKKANFIEQLIQNEMLVTLDDFNSGITNCITEIPQDIKLEIVDGTVVLKAGSKVYVPNGVGVFDNITIEQDLTITSTGTGTRTLYYTYADRNIVLFSSDADASGTTPSGTVNYYDTSANTVYRYNSGVRAGQLSFPLAHITITNGVITKIDQVFNGFGYIGSTVFALPGVKGLTPDGRNEEGTLKNVYWTTSSIILRTYSSAYSGEYDIFFNGGSFGALKKTYVYDEESNYNMDSNNRYNSTYIGRAYITSGTISYFATKNAFHAVDYSDTGFIAHQSMPSDKYIDLNLGQSGAVYTAPADGFVCLRAKTTVAGKTYCITNEVNGMQNMVTVDNLGGEFGICLPVSDGQVFSVEYGGALDSGYVFRFVFLNAAK